MKLEPFDLDKFMREDIKDEVLNNVRSLFKTINVIDYPEIVGSSRFLFDDSINLEELRKYKPQFKDIDIQVNSIHKYKFKKYFIAGNKIGNYEIISCLHHGNESSVTVHHPDKDHYNQLDFEYVYKLDHNFNHPFLHSANWDDCKLGIKGVHHKLLLNVIDKKFKFSITHGLRLRNDDSLFFAATPNDIGDLLFGVDNYDVSNIWSFSGLVKEINHSRNYNHDGICERFINNCDKTKDDSYRAISYLGAFLE